MFSVLRKSSIGLRIGLLCLLPLIALASVSAMQLVSEFRTAREAKFVLDMLDKAPIVSNLVHELQKERGTSAGFLGSKGKTFADAIKARRSETDDRLALFRRSAPLPEGRLGFPAYAEPYERVVTALARIDEIRGKIDRFEIAIPDMAAFYTPLIADLLRLIESVGVTIEDGKTLRNLMAYSSLLQGKEQAGLERAMGAAGFGSGTFSEAIHRNFVRLGAMQDTLFATFRKLADKNDVDTLNAALSGPTEEKVTTFRQAAYAAPFGGDIGAITGPHWFAASTGRIDALKSVEDKVIVTIQERASVAARNADLAFWTVAAILVALILVTAGVSLLVYRSIVPPIARLVETMRRLARNETSLDVAGLDQVDEIGDMARAVAVFKGNAIERLRLETQARIERERESHRQARVETLVKDFRSVVTATLENADTRTTDMRNASRALTAIAEEAAAQSHAARSATDDASRSVEITASATRQLSSSIRDIAEQTGKANVLMGETEKRAVVTNENVSRLSSAADEIGSVVSIIRDIAEQTNLLALNATIEAARAGEAGRGFAVVASEVKDLAGQTAKATAEIAAQVAGIQGSTSEAVRSINGITEAMTEVRRLMSHIAGSVDEQLASTVEISDAVGVASSGTSVASGNVESVSQSIARTARFAGDVDGTSTVLAEATTRLARAVERFLADVSTDVEERRSALRKQVRQVVLISSGGQRLQSEILDISTTGARIGPISATAIGSRLHIQLSTGEVVAAKVVCQTDGEVGVQFDSAIGDIDALVAA